MSSSSINVTITINNQLIKQMSEDGQLAAKAVEPIKAQMITKLEGLYDGSDWKGEVYDGRGKRGAYVFATDDRSVPFREAATGRARQALRGGL